MEKIFLGEIDDVATQHWEGSLPKFWVELNGQKYLFKSNLTLPYRVECPTDMGEVLYSVLGERLGLSCVESNFASYKKNGKEVNGVLIKSYYNNDYEFSVNYGDMVTEINRSYSHELSGNVETALEVVGKYSKRHNYSIKMRKTSMQLKKQSILDFFLHQEDRSICNVGFIANNNTLRLAPVFDNGFCLSFAKENQFNQLFISLHKRGLGYSNLLSNYHFPLKPIPSLEYEQENIRQIHEATQESRALNRYVEKILDINIKRELENLESVRQKPLKKSYKRVADALFERRKDLFLKEIDGPGYEI